MNINSRKPSQFELFPSSCSSAQDDNKAAPQIKDFTLSIENLIVVCIVLVMAGVLFFSFGVERGKHLTNNTESGPEINTGQSGNNDIMLEPSAGVNTPKAEIPSGQAEPVEPEVEILENSGEIPETPEKPFTVQVASFKLEVNAEKEATNLKDIGYESFVMSKGSYSIVCVGKFEQHMEAKEFSDRLKNRYRDLIVRRL